MEYAEEFTQKEKYQRIALTMLFATFIVITHEKWVFPFISWYASTAHCHTPLGFSGASVLWYSVFVGLPLLCAIVIGVVSIPLGIKGLRDKQFPPQGIKVYKPTKIMRGWKATVKSAMHLVIPIALILMSIWGIFQAGKMPVNVPDDFDYSSCKKLTFISNEQG